MSVQVENLEHNMAKLTIEVDAAEFDAAARKYIIERKVPTVFRDSVRARFR